MASQHLSEQELSCPVCCEIYKSPVVLSCGHSSCKECLEQFWKTSKTQECPVCRRRSTEDGAFPNRALGGVCESFLKERNESSSSGSEEICSLHNKPKQPVCVVCRDSQQHNSHTHRPISEFVSSHQKRLTLSLLEKGNPSRYRLLQNTGSSYQFKEYRKSKFGFTNHKKTHKTILLVGETGTGKTTLINVMINYMLGVKREDKVWIEITDHRCSQTDIVTVYEIYLQESPMDLTIIDTPGYGDTCEVEKEKKIAVSLLSLCKSGELHKIDAVCLVIHAALHSLSSRQQYIFDAVQSLFGRDFAENIVLLFTHSTGAPPKDALRAVREAQVKCAVNEQKNQPVYFLFDNCQSEAADEEYRTIQEQSWNLSFKGMTQLFRFLDNIKPKALKMIEDVLRQHIEFEAKCSSLRSHVKLMELKQQKLKETQAALEKEKNKNFEYEVDVSYKEKVDIDPAVASVAMCCTVCEENCHYPGCWWVSGLSWCVVMSNGHCTVCTNKCHYSKHVKAAKIYVTKTKKEKRTNINLKMKNKDRVSYSVSEVSNLTELYGQKIKLAIEAFHCVQTLQLIALNTDALNVLVHIDLLIEQLKEIKEPEKAKTLETIQKRARKGQLETLGYIYRMNFRLY